MRPPLDRWTLTVDALRGRAWPAPPELPGQVHVCADSPIADADLAGADIDEARRILGRTRAYAEQRLAEINSQPAPDGAQPEAQP